MAAAALVPKQAAATGMVVVVARAVRIRRRSIAPTIWELPNLCRWEQRQRVALSTLLTVQREKREMTACQPSSAITTVSLVEAAAARVVLAALGMTVRLVSWGCSQVAEEVQATTLPKLEKPSTEVPLAAGLVAGEDWQEPTVGHSQGWLMPAAQRQEELLGRTMAVLARIPPVTCAGPAAEEAEVFSLLVTLATAEMEENMVAEVVVVEALRTAQARMAAPAATAARASAW